MQMLAEWISKQNDGRRWLMRVRLGAPKPSVPRPDMTPEERALIGTWRRWADAVGLGDEDVLIVESAIRSQPGKISQLELYALLFPQTPEFTAWKGLPVKMVLLYAIEDPATILLARQKGIKCILYKPTWLPAYLEILQPRERRGVRF